MLAGIEGLGNAVYILNVFSQLSTASQREMESLLRERKSVRKKFSFRYNATGFAVQHSPRPIYSSLTFKKGLVVFIVTDLILRSVKDTRRCAECSIHNRLCSLNRVQKRCISHR